MFVYEYCACLMLLKGLANLLLLFVLGRLLKGLANFVCSLYSVFAVVCCALCVVLAVV